MQLARASMVSLLFPFAAGIQCGGQAQPSNPNNYDAAIPDESGADSGSTFGSDAGTDAGSRPVADVFIQSIVQPSPGSAPACRFGSQRPWLTLGLFNGTGIKPATVQSGSSQLGDRLSVTCLVRADGNGFDVSIDTGLSNNQELIISGEKGAVSAATGGQGITGVFNVVDMGSPGAQYQAGDCSIAFTYAGQPVPESPPIAPGRIWGHLSCPDAQNMGQTEPAVDGGVSFETCDFETDFLFENCNQ